MCEFVCMCWRKSRGAWLLGVQHSEGLGEELFRIWLFCSVLNAAESPLESIWKSGPCWGWIEFLMMFRSTNSICTCMFFSSRCLFDGSSLETSWYNSLIQWNVEMWEPVPAGQHILTSGPAAFCMVALLRVLCFSRVKLSDCTSVQLMAFLAGVLLNWV